MKVALLAKADPVPVGPLERAEQVGQAADAAHPPQHLSVTLPAVSKRAPTPHPVMPCPVPDPSPRAQREPVDAPRAPAPVQIQREVQTPQVPQTEMNADQSPMALASPEPVPTAVPVGRR
jgi:hypothetical protein